MRDPCLILAGGKGSRINISKSLIQVAGKPWLRIQVERLHLVGFTRILTVFGHHAAKELKTFPELESIVSPNPDGGPFVSLQTGLNRLLMSQVSGAFILPIDVPVPRAAVWRRISKVNGYSVVIPTCESKTGHPVWVSRSFAESLTKIDLGNAAARLDTQIQLVEPAQVGCVEVSYPGILLNLNTAKEWERARFW